MKRILAAFLLLVLVLCGCSGDGGSKASASEGQHAELDQKIIDEAMKNAVDIENRPDENICYVKIDCSKAVESGKLSSQMMGILPSDGIILESLTVEFEDGATAFDAALSAIKKSNLHFEYKGSQKAPYIEGIDNVYEFDCGPLSGWMYRVNGWIPSFGMGQYKVLPGDTVELVYTCDLGKDIGDPYYSMG